MDDLSYYLQYEGRADYNNSSWCLVPERLAQIPQRGAFLSSVLTPERHHKIRSLFFRVFSIHRSDFANVGWGKSYLLYSSSMIISFSKFIPGNKLRLKASTPTSIISKKAVAVTAPRIYNNYNISSSSGKDVVCALILQST